MTSMATFAMAIGAMALIGMGIFAGISDTESSVIAHNFAIYRNTVTTYALQNANATGSLPDNTLTFPEGFVRRTEWDNRVEDNVIYVYGPATPQTIIEAGQLFRCSAAVGRNDQQQLYRACDGQATGISLPAFIQSGDLTSVIGR